MNEKAPDSGNQHIGHVHDTKQTNSSSKSTSKSQHLKPPHAVLLSPRRLSDTSEAFRTSSTPYPYHERRSLSWGSRDPEKASHKGHSMHSHESLSHHGRNIASDVDSDLNDEDEDPRRHVVWILLYLSTLALLLALPIAFYTILATFLLIILTPIFICTRRWAISSLFHRFLSPAPQFQLGLIFSDFEPDPHSTGNMALLIIASILAPMYAIFIALAAWVAGVFWFYTAILRDPDGKEERDDGREAVLAVGRWWEKWLVQGLS